MDESFLRLIGKKVSGKDNNKYFGRLSDILVNKETKEIIGIVAKNESLLYRYRLFLMKDVVWVDEVKVYVKGFGERFVKVVPIYTEYKSCANDIYKKSAVLQNGTAAGKIQNINFDFEAGIISEFEVGVSLAQDLLTGRKICPINNTITFRQGKVVLDNK